MIPERKLDHRLFRQDRLQHPQIIAAEDQSDFVVLVAVALQAVEQIRQVFDFLEAFDQRIFMQRDGADPLACAVRRI